MTTLVKVTSWQRQIRLLTILSILASTAERKTISFQAVRRIRHYQFKGIISSIQSSHLIWICRSLSFQNTKACHIQIFITKNLKLFLATNKRTKSTIFTWVEANPVKSRNSIIHPILRVMKVHMLQKILHRIILQTSNTIKTILWKD